MTGKILRKENYRTQPWKNGRGITTEIAIEPRGVKASSENFLWRISYARIEKNAEFSLFPQHKRILMILSGEGIRLKQNGELHVLRQLEGFEFSGSEAISCELLAGPVMDFNVFTRQGGALATLTVHHGNLIRLKPQAKWNFVFAWQGEFSFQEDLLHDGDTLEINNADQEIEFRSNGLGSLLYTGINFLPT